MVQWLRDGLKIIDAAPETQSLAVAADPAQDLVLVPAFTGLGAPYWRPECRGAVFGLTRNSGPAEFARAALESVGFQTRDLLEAMTADWPGGSGDNVLRVDGGMTASDWTMQFLSDILGAPVDRPEILETTALGAAWLAGMRAGVYPDAAWELRRPGRWSADLSRQWTRRTAALNMHVGKMLSPQRNERLIAEISARTLAITENYGDSAIARYGVRTGSCRDGICRGSEWGTARCAKAFSATCGTPLGKDADHATGSRLARRTDAGGA